MTDRNYFTLIAIIFIAQLVPWWVAAGAAVTFAIAGIMKDEE